MWEPPEKRLALEKIGLRNLGRISWNASTPLLYEEILARQEGKICHLGPIVVRPGQHTFRSALDYYLVQEPGSPGPGRLQSLSEGNFIGLFLRLQAFLQNKDIFIQDCYLGAAPDYKIPLRIITETAWHNLLSRNLFIQMLNLDEAKTHKPAFTVIHVPSFRAEPDVDGTNTGAFVILHPGKNLVLCGGSSYGGELRKAVVAMALHHYPTDAFLPLHSAAILGPDPALLVGRSDSGKTTLATTAGFSLVGDDGHGWTDQGMFTFESGSYPKVFRLSVDEEPEIYKCTRRFGTILENVGMESETRRVNLEDDSLTGNTRAAYPNSHIPGALRLGVCSHPRYLIILTYDTFGVLPPVARLTPGQAAYHVLTGYKGQVAATASGRIEPVANFAAASGLPLLKISPEKYAQQLLEKIERHQVSCWLVNTGWTGRAYGEGSRIKISTSRAILRNILNGSLSQADYTPDPSFGFQVPQTCAGVPSELLNPRTAARDITHYETRAQALVAAFRQNFQQYEADIHPGIAAGKL